MRDPELIRAVAHHESGHAAVCFVLYGDEVIKSVQVYSRDGVAGRTSTYSRLPIPIVCRPPIGAPRRGNPAPVSADAIVDAHGVLSYAGIAAERLMSRELSGRAWVEPGPSGDQARRGWVDREALAKLASVIGVSRPADHFFTEYCEEATRLLRIHSKSVETLAGALIEHGSLHGARVDALLLAGC